MAIFFGVAIAACSSEPATELADLADISTLPPEHFENITSVDPGGPCETAVTDRSEYVSIEGIAAEAIALEEGWEVTRYATAPPSADRWIEGSQGLPKFFLVAERNDQYLQFDGRNHYLRFETEGCPFGRPQQPETMVEVANFPSLLLETPTSAADDLAVDLAGLEPLRFDSQSRFEYAPAADRICRMVPFEFRSSDLRGTSNAVADQLGGAGWDVQRQRSTVRNSEDLMFFAQRGGETVVFEGRPLNGMSLSWYPSGCGEQLPVQKDWQRVESF